MAAAAAAARKAADDLFANAGTVRERGPEADDMDIDLAIDGEEEFADSRPQPAAAPAAMYRVLQDKIAQRQQAPQAPPPPPQPTPEERQRAAEEKGMSTRPEKAKRRHITPHPPVSPQRNATRNVPVSASRCSSRCR